ncbi:unnamed protein product [Ilex paraguariensis]|uniref:Uncharacterized protein n=1 Tax=Ilex paraguariensis TaxID=185542 RepID=A0ABC8UQM6_9AQUA
MAGRDYERSRMEHCVGLFFDPPPPPRSGDERMKSKVDKNLCRDMLRAVGASHSSHTKPVMNNTSNKDEGKNIITLLGDVGGAMEVPQPGKSLPQVGNMDASSSSAIKSVNNQCPNGP